MLFYRYIFFVDLFNLYIMLNPTLCIVFNKDFQKL